METPENVEDWPSIRAHLNSIQGGTTLKPPLGSNMPTEHGQGPLPGRKTNKHAITDVTGAAPLIETGENLSKHPGQSNPL